MQALPISTVFDARLCGLVSLAIDGRADQALVERYPWVVSYFAEGRHRDLIKRASFELPFPIEVWNRTGGRTIDGIPAHAAVIDIAEAAGWTMDQLMEQTGCRRFEGFAQFSIAVLVTIRQSREDDEIWTYRQYHRSSRAALDCLGRDGTG